MCFERQSVLGKQHNRVSNFFKTLLSGKMWKKIFHSEGEY